MEGGYGRHSYYDDGEIRGRRTTEWYKENLPEFEFVENILDIGSGNGRLNKILHSKCKNLYNLEPEIDLHDNFRYDNLIWNKVFFEHFIPPEGVLFDIICLFGTFYIFKDKSTTFRELRKLLKNDGKIVITDDLNNYDIQDIIDIAKEEKLYISDRKVIAIKVKPPKILETYYYELKKEGE